MKKIFLILLLSVCVTYQSQGQQKEKSNIKAVIKTYFEGQRKDSRELIKQVFHEDAVLKFISVRDNQYKTIPLEGYLSFFNSKKERVFTDKIFYIDHVGTAANSKVLVKYDTYQYTHYFNMLRTKHGRKIVSKISSQENF